MKINIENTCVERNDIEQMLKDGLLKSGSIVTYGETNEMFYMILDQEDINRHLSSPRKDRLRCVRLQDGFFTYFLTTSRVEIVEAVLNVKVCRKS